MREIKFRAWDKELKFMLYGEDIENSDGYFCGLSYGKLFIWYHKENGDYEELDIMQYTGLKDKNGKEIYEGDIVKHRYGRLGEIYFWEGSFMFGKPCVPSSSMTKFKFPNFNEIIGNIYENPEFLEVIE